MGSKLFSNRYTEPHGRHRKKRPKTFASSEAAKKYAEAHSLKGYELVNMHLYSSVPKIKIVIKE